MRIALLTSEYPTEANFDGGLANYLRRTAHLLADAGHDVEIFTRCFQYDPDWGILDPVDEVFEHGNHLVHRVAHRWPGEFFYHYLPVFKRFSGYRSELKWAWALNTALERRHREKPFDIVQAATARACGVVASWRQRIPLVTRASSIRLLCDAAEQQTTTSANRQRDRLVSLQMRRSQSVYAPSRHVCDLVSDRYCVRARVLEPPVDLAPFSNATFACPETERSERYVLHFGTLGRLKGTDRLISILPQLCDRISDLRFVFIGTSKQDECDRSYHSLIQQCCSQHSDRISVLPAMRHPELFRYVAHARVVVLPSRIDNLPNTCLESMAFQRVVVATRDASFEQLIEHTQNGFLTPQEDNDALLQQIEQAWNLSDPERQRIGKAARHALERMAPKRAIGELVQLFEQVSGGVPTTHVSHPRTNTKTKCTPKKGHP